MADEEDVCNIRVVCHFAEKETSEYEDGYVTPQLNDASYKEEFGDLRVLLRHQSPKSLMRDEKQSNEDPGLLATEYSPSDIQMEDERSSQSQCSDETNPDYSSHEKLVITVKNDRIGYYQTENSPPTDSDNTSITSLCDNQDDNNESNSPLTCPAEDIPPTSAMEGNEKSENITSCKLLSAEIQTEAISNTKPVQITTPQAIAKDNQPAVKILEKPDKQRPLCKVAASINYHASNTNLKDTTSSTTQPTLEAAASTVGVKPLPEAESPCTTKSSAQTPNNKSTASQKMSNPTDAKDPCTKAELIGTTIKPLPISNLKEKLSESKPLQPPPIPTSMEAYEIDVNADRSSIDSDSSSSSRDSSYSSSSGSSSSSSSSSSSASSYTSSDRKPTRSTKSMNSSDDEDEDDEKRSWRFNKSVSSAVALPEHSKLNSNSERYRDTVRVKSDKRRTDNRPEKQSRQNKYDRSSSMGEREQNRSKRSIEPCNNTKGEPRDKIKREEKTTDSTKVPRPLMEIPISVEERSNDNFFRSNERRDRTGMHDNSYQRNRFPNSIRNNNNQSVDLLRGNNLDTRRKPDPTKLKSLLDLKLPGISLHRNHDTQLRAVDDRRYHHTKSHQNHGHVPKRYKDDFANEDRLRDRPNSRPKTSSLAPVRHKRPNSDTFFGVDITQKHKSDSTYKKNTDYISKSASNNDKSNQPNNDSRSSSSRQPKRDAEETKYESRTKRSLPSSRRPRSKERNRVSSGNKERERRSSRDYSRSKDTQRKRCKSPDGYKKSGDKYSRQSSRRR